MYFAHFKIVFFFFVCTCGTAQNNSLAQLYNTPPNLNGKQDYRKIVVYKNQLEELDCYKYSALNLIPSAQTEFYKQAYNIAGQHNAKNVMRFYRALHLKTLTYGEKATFKREALFFLEIEDNLKTPISLLIARNLALRSIGDQEFEYALDYLYLFDELKERYYKGNPITDDFSAGQRAYVLFQLGDYSEALIHYKKRAIIYKAIGENPRDFVGRYHDIGLCFAKLNQKDSTLFYYKKALAQLEVAPDDTGTHFLKAMINRDINKQFLETGNYKKIITGLEELLQLAIQVKDNLQIISSLIELAELYYLQNDLNKATTYLNQVFERYNRGLKNHYVERGLNLRIKIHFKNRNFKKADSLQTVLTAFKDSTQTILSKRIHKNSKTKHTLRINTKKLRASEKKRKEEKTNLYYILVGVFTLVIITGVSVFAYVRNRKNQKKILQQNVILDQSAKEKEVLLKEVHHRVKNNLQIISSILQLQSDKFDNQQLKKIMKEGQHRIQSMAIVHQQLYGSESLSEINFKKYVEQLTRQIRLGYQDPEKEINVIIQIQECTFTIPTTIPLGLIINELVSNAYKYAFKNKKEGTISIEVKQLKTHDYQLMVKDNGKGIQQDLNIEEINSLGLKLVRILTHQLQGNFSYKNDEGAQFMITFKDNVTV